MNDVILNARMADALENIHVFTINVFPNDVKNQDEIDTNRFFHSIDNTVKHVMGGVYSMNGCKKAVELAEMVAGSPQALRSRPFVSFITLIISPFKIDDQYGEMACYLARKCIPVVVPTEPICGTTSPITLAGNVLTHIAETLGGIAMVQCVKKGAPGICGSVGSITNLHTMNHVGGAIERAMINAAVSQLAQHFEIPLYSTGGTSDALEVDIQASYESAMSSHEKRETQGRKTPAETVKQYVDTIRCEKRVPCIEKTVRDRILQRFPEIKKSHLWTNFSG